MTAKHYGPNENGRFTLEELERLPGFRRTHGGTRSRSACPIHGGDNPGAFVVDFATGRGHCFTHGCWGYLDDGARGKRDGYGSPPPAIPRPVPPDPPDPERVALLRGRWPALTAAFPGSPAAAYLAGRRIPPAVTQAVRVGFDGEGWLGPSMTGRLVFPLAALDGTPINVSGRVIRPDDRRPRWLNLPGARGYFNPRAIRQARETGGTLYLCEGLVDVLALLAGGVTTAAALCGTAGLVREDVRGIARLILCFDADAAGQGEGLRVGRLAASVGCEVLRLTADELDGAKDVAEYWQCRGTLPPGLGGAPDSDPILLDLARKHAPEEIVARIARIAARIAGGATDPLTRATLADWEAIAAIRATLDMEAPRPRLVSHEAGPG